VSPALPSATASLWRCSDRDPAPSRGIHRCARGTHHRCDRCRKHRRRDSSARRRGLRVGVPLFAMAAAGFAGIGTLPPLLLLGAGLFCSNYLMLSGICATRPAAPGGDSGVRPDSRFRFRVHAARDATAARQARADPGWIQPRRRDWPVGLVLTLIGVVSLLARARLSLPRPIVVDVLAGACRSRHLLVHQSQLCLSGHSGCLRAKHADNITVRLFKMPFHA